MTAAVRHITLLVLACLTAAGCASPRAAHGRFVVPAGEYEAAFDQTRSSLVAMGYRLDRVDARLGVVTTHPKRASAVHADFVSVRVEFTPADRFGRLPSDAVRTQIDAKPWSLPELSSTALVGEVTALRERTYRPRFRPQAVDALRSGRVSDPLLEARLGGGEMTVPITREVDVEERVAGRIASRLPPADQSSAD